MRIAGVQKLTLLDFPGRVACTVFTPGCNFVCPFCQNSRLVLGADKEPGIDMEEFQVFSIVKLTADSLVIADEEDTYEYSHPSKNDDEDLDIDLDEGYDDEFRI